MKGKISVTEHALAAIVGLAAHEVPGVAGMSPVGIRDGISRILGRSEASQGVVVKADSANPGHYQSDIYVVVAYGVKVPTVVESIAERAEWAAEKLAGVKLDRITVHVVGVSRG